MPTGSRWMTTNSNQHPWIHPGSQQAPGNPPHTRTLVLDKLHALPTDLPWISTSYKQVPQDRFGSRQSAGNSNSTPWPWQFPQTCPRPRQAPDDPHRLALVLDKHLATPTNFPWNSTSSKRFPQGDVDSERMVSIRWLLNLWNPTARLPRCSHRAIPMDNDKPWAIPTDLPWIPTSSEQFPQARQGSRQAPSNSNRFPLDLDKLQALPTRGWESADSRRTVSIRWLLNLRNPTHGCLGAFGSIWCARGAYG